MVWRRSWNDLFAVAIYTGMMILHNNSLEMNEMYTNYDDETRMV